MGVSKYGIKVSTSDQYVSNCEGGHVLAEAMCVEQLVGNLRQPVLNVAASCAGTGVSLMHRVGAAHWRGTPCHVLSCHIASEWPRAELGV